MSDRSLLDHHRAHLKTSGLADETIDAAAIFSVSDAKEAAKLLNWDSSAAPVPAIVFPQFDRSGQTFGCVLRPDTPRVRDGKPVKYESPMGSTPRPYFAPAALVPSTRWLQSNQPLIFVEGIKKALRTIESGGIAISCQGTTVWHDVAARKADSEWKLHPDLLGVVVKGREVLIGFDGGDTTTNAAVIHAEARLCALARAAGARVRLLRIPCPPDGGKVGIDDYLSEQTNPRAALKRLIKDAVEGDPLERARAIRAAADPPKAAAALLDDLGFAATLSIAPDHVVDTVARELKQSAGIGRRSITRAVDAFLAKLRTQASKSRRSASAKDAQNSADDEALRTSAEALLGNPKLLDVFLADVSDAGLVGEQAAAITILLSAVQRKTARPLHVVVKASSAAGKNALVRAVTAFVPPEDVVEISDMTERSLLYLGESMAGKMFVICEQDGADKAEYAMRVAMSEGALSVLVPVEVNDEKGRRYVSERHEVAGPATFITTTTRGSLHDENETRVLEVNLDESIQQTMRILAAQAMRAATPRVAIDSDYASTRQRTWQTALRALEPRNVVIPQAPQLAKAFPATLVRARRDFQRLLSLIGAHALLHQRQRRVVGDDVVAEDVDVAAAQRLLQSDAAQVPGRVTKAADRLREAFGSTSSFTPVAAAKVLGYHADATRRLLHSLAEYELAEQLNKPVGSQAAYWRLVGPQAPLPGNGDAAESARAKAPTEEGGADGYPF